MTSTSDTTVDSPQITLIADDIHLTYNVRVAQENKARRIFGSSGKRDTVQALRGISLAAREGEFIGLIGRNGSGKSTLLRVLAGLETPTAGSVLASSKPQLMGVSAALMPNLTGIDNIRIGLLAMGLSPEEAAARMDRVAELADIGDSIRMPMRTYSSGMTARLRFSISVAADPEILMIDEALSTGDGAFKERSNDAMRDLIARSGTGFLVNHSSSAIRDLCTRVIWMDKGEIIEDGPTEKLIVHYNEFLRALRRRGEKSGALVKKKYRQTLEDRAQRILEGPEPIDKPVRDENDETDD